MEREIRQNEIPLAASIGQEFVLGKCNYFLDLQLWPKKTKVNPEAWLSNFRSNELDAAIHLLNGFVFFSSDLVEQLFFAAFQGLSTRIAPDYPQEAAIEHWQTFLDSLMITRVTGEIPSDTDSGFIFQRMARQVLRISESQVIGPNEVIEHIQNTSSGNVVFVDDFVGSGNQFLDTWHKHISTANGTMSFNMLAQSVNDTQFFYCPLVCTEEGYNRIEASCPGLMLAPVHILPRRYSALVADSIFWPPELKDSGPSFIQEASARAGIPEDSWKGYHGLGLALAFYHCIPDASLPIFYWNQNGWKPLMERS